MILKLAERKRVEKGFIMNMYFENKNKLFKIKQTYLLNLPVPQKMHEAVQQPMCADKQLSLLLEYSFYCSSSEGENCKSTNTSYIKLYHVKSNPFSTLCQTMKMLSWKGLRLVHNSD